MENNFHTYDSLLPYLQLDIYNLTFSLTWKMLGRKDLTKFSEALETPAAFSYYDIYLKKNLFLYLAKYCK